MSRRPDSDYEIESASKVLMVLEALEGIGFEPVTLSTIVGRTGFSRDFVFRALKTLQMRGYATRLASGKWTAGKRFVRLGISAARNLEESK